MALREVSGRRAKGFESKLLGKGAWRDGALPRLCRLSVAPEQDRIVDQRPEINVWRAVFPYLPLEGLTIPNSRRFQIKRIENVFVALIFSGLRSIFSECAVSLPWIALDSLSTPVGLTGY